MAKNNCLVNNESPRDRRNRINGFYFSKLELVKFTLRRRPSSYEFVAAERQRIILFNYHDKMSPLRQ